MPEGDVVMRCKYCGADLSNVFDADASEGQVLCPECGYATGLFKKSLRATVSANPQFSALGSTERQELAYRESPWGGLASTADRLSDGSVSSVLTGRSPQGEEDTLPTCRRLIEALNRTGANWGEPQESDRVGVVDCYAHDRRDTRTLLSVQVTRAVRDQKRWESLNCTGKFQQDAVGVGQFAKYLKEAITAKANDIPEVSRHGLVLALDAGRLPAAAFHAKEIRLQIGTWAGELGFAAVWLVGPTCALTSRLDVSSSKEERTIGER